MVYFLLANGFVESEAIAPVDMIKRAGEDAVFVSVSDSLTVTGAHGIKIVADIFLNEVSAENGKMIVLPGGLPGVTNLDVAEGFDEVIKSFVEKSRYIGAICAAPSLLGKRGYLDGVKAVCYPEATFEQQLTKAELQKAKVVRDGNFITAVGAGASIEFGLELVTVLSGNETAERIRNGIKL